VEEATELVWQWALRLGHVTAADDDKKRQLCGIFCITLPAYMVKAIREGVKDVETQPHADLDGVV
jgi:hypothetical protein